jgi:hypothetical protein
LDTTKRTNCDKIATVAANTTEIIRATGGNTNIEEDHLNKTEYFKVVLNDALGLHLSACGHVVALMFDAA